MSSAPGYPFSALVAQEDLKLCLMLLALNPRIGGVLIRGEKGAAKSTAARALAELLPPKGDVPAPFVNLPLGATEDRVLGSLDLEHALRGERKLQPGLLGKADGGVLYVDEVNLLPDHLVDVLLDAAAMGVNHLEREGLSLEEPSRFALVGSMNPEEGSLRPQLLDRFGLCVDVLAPRDVGTRAVIVRQRLLFEAEPEAFRARYAAEQDTLRTQLAEARVGLPEITPSDACLSEIAERCHEANVSSLRADLVLARSATAYAALCGERTVTGAHVARVAPFVFAHRQPDGSRAPHASNPRAPMPETPSSGGKDAPAQSSPERTGDDVPEYVSNRSSPPKAEQVFDVGGTLQGLPPGLEGVTDRSVNGQTGRLKTALDTSRGRATRSVKVLYPEQLALADSVRHALIRTASEGQALERLTPDDLYGYERQGGSRARLLVLLDSSGSLATRRRMVKVKGVVARLLEQACGWRDEVSLVAFRGVQAQCLVAWTRDVDLARGALEALPTGGRTPLAQGLTLALELLDPAYDTRLVLLTDGRSNVPLQEGGDAWQDALRAARLLRNVPAAIVDTDESFVRVTRLRELAAVLGANYVSLEGQAGA